MLASPLMPTPGFPDDASQYRPAKDIEAFKSLLPPPIEFVEGSSSGTLMMEEGKYQPINASPKSPKASTQDVRKVSTMTPKKSAKAPLVAGTSGKQLYTGSLNTTWPSGGTVGSGLHNTGNTCFLNSALQCLLHTPPLLHVLNAHSKSDTCRVPKGAFCMACSLRQVMLESHGKRRSFAPYPITTKLNAIAKHMRRGRQEDSHEFLRYAIDALQKSCLAGLPSKLDPKITETTWLHKIFGGRLRSRVTCMECGYNSDTFDSVLDLSVDIYGVSGLNQALKKFTAVDHLRGADKYKCDKCKKPVTAEKQFTIHEAPLVLTIHLKRFSPMGRKINHVIKYDERLSLKAAMSDGQHGPTYTLYGVISHAGGGPNSGHYFAHVKGGDGHWYEMNDDSVSREHSAPTSLSNAYILFYIREKGQALDAALSAPPSTPISTPPSKASLVANMKKRKAVDSDDETGTKPPKLSKSTPFIGPLLPSTTPNAQGRFDPQADKLRKKIAAVSKSPSKALQSLSQYTDDDDDDDDVGEKVEVPPSSLTEEKSPTPLLPPPSLTTPSKSTDPSEQSKAKVPSAIPASRFYGDSAKKRKSPDDDDEDSSVKRASESSAFSSPSSAKERRQVSSQNPFSRLKGSNNLQQRRESAPPLRRYGKKRRAGAV